MENTVISLSFTFTPHEVKRILAIRTLPDGEIINHHSIDNFTDLCDQGIVTFLHDRDNCREYYLTRLGRLIAEDLGHSNL